MSQIMEAERCGFFVPECQFSVSIQFYSLPHLDKLRNHWLV
jgi:hypothetical protein